MNKKIFIRILLVVNLLVVVSLACALTDQAKDVKEGIETVQGIATMVDESGLVETGQAVATQIDESGIKETAQAAATEIDESGAAETAKAALTEVVVDESEIPDDVPLMDGYTGLYGTDTEITYSVDAGYQAVIDFYRTEMPISGWTETNALLNDMVSQLTFTKGDRKVDIIITEVPILGVQVVIAMQ